MDDEVLKSITLSSIEERYTELSSSIVRTPSVKLTSPFLIDLIKASQIYLKLECFQYSGTFKARGALSVTKQIPEKEKKFGITAASAGNHAIAAAWAAKVENLSAKVVMQTSANPFRISLAKTFGAEIIMKEGGVATFAEADKLMREERRTFIHPFDGLDTTLGAAGVGLELIEDYTELDAVVVAVGGGGLISGVAAAVKLQNSKCKVYGVEPLGANSMSQSMVVNKPVTLDSVNTIADSLAPPMALPFSYSVCKKFVDQFVTVTDNQICAGLSLLQEECKLAVEPAAGAVLAGAIWPLRKQLVGKKIGLIICGANIDAQSYGRFLKQGYEKLKAEF